MCKKNVFKVLVNVSVQSVILMKTGADFASCICQIGRTEKIMNCLNPKFSKTFVIDYYFEMVQKLRFEVYDIDSDACSVQDADFLGELECTLGQVGCLSGSRRWKTQDKVMNLKVCEGKTSL